MGLSAILGAAGSVVGAIGEARGQRGSRSFDVAPAGGFEQFGQRLATQNLSQLRDLTRAGPGRQDVAAGLEAQRELASRLQTLSQTGNLPSTEDVARARAFGQDIFGAQQVGLQQQFQQDLQSASRRAAAQGRLDDPILRARLLENRNLAQERLGAQQRGFVAQQAQLQPQQRLAFQAQQADILGGLGQQALQNRLTLAGQGQAIQARQQAFRAQTATQNFQSGGGAAGGIAGAIGGLGAGLSAGSRLGGIFGGGGASTQPGAVSAGAPQAQTFASQPINAGAPAPIFQLFPQFQGIPQQSVFTRFPTFQGATSTQPAAVRQGFNF